MVIGQRQRGGCHAIAAVARGNQRRCCSAGSHGASSALGRRGAAYRRASSSGRGCSGCTAGGQQRGCDGGGQGALGGARLEEILQTRLHATSQPRRGDSTRVVNERQRAATATNTRVVASRLHHTLTRAPGVSRAMSGRLATARRRPWVTCPSEATSALRRAAMRSMARSARSCRQAIRQPVPASTLVRSGRQHSERRSQRARSSSARASAGSGCGRSHADLGRPRLQGDDDEPVDRLVDKVGRLELPDAAHRLARVPLQVILLHGVHDGRLELRDGERARDVPHVLQPLVAVGDRQHRLQQQRRRQQQQRQSACGAWAGSRADSMQRAALVGPGPCLPPPLPCCPQPSPARRCPPRGCSGRRRSGRRAVGSRPPHRAPAANQPPSTQQHAARTRTRADSKW